MTHAHRARTALTAMLAHPDATRRPDPSAAAARYALRPLGTLSERARRTEGAATERDLVAIAVCDALTDAFHLGRTCALSPSDLEQLHLIRTAGLPFPASTTDREAALGYYLGNLRSLAVAYELDDTELVRKAEETYKHEIA